MDEEEKEATFANFMMYARWALMLLGGLSVLKGLFVVFAANRPDLLDEVD